MALLTTRRRALALGLTAVGALSGLPRPARAQRKPLIKIRYNEVVRSILYAPAYAAIANRFFEEAGLDVTLATGQGPDRSMAALLGGGADIALIGPDAAFFVMASDSPTKALLFCGLTATDGFMLMGRQKLDKFDWNMLRGKEILARQPGSTPQIFLEAALRLNGLDPYKDVKLINNVAIPARVGSWLAGQNQYGIFLEPDASQLELDGKAYTLASLGPTVAYLDYTTFMATDKYIHDNPEIIQAWTNAIYKAMKWTDAAPTADVVKVLEPYFPGVTNAVLTSATERYRALKIWKTTPAIDQAGMEKFQDLLVQANVLDPAKRVKFADLVRTEFANNAK
jgi:NitT/TauT family transport system substrate-binding protein